MNKLALACWLVGLASASARPFILGWDDFSARSSHALGMNFDRSPGDLEITDFDAHLPARGDFGLTENLTFQPAFDSSTTILRFNDVPTSILIDKNNLQSFSVYPSTVEASALLCWTSPDTPWMFGAWTRLGLASDFRNISGDDVIVEFAGGSAYRFSETVSMGFGAAVVDLSGNSEFQPGLGLDWRVSNTARVAVCGPNAEFSYIPDENWKFSLLGNSTGQLWNISDGEGKSRDIDLQSYRIGLQINLRIRGGLSLGIGGGVTLGNEISLEHTNGDEILKQRLDSGYYGMISLNLVTW